MAKKNKNLVNKDMKCMQESDKKKYDLVWLEEYKMIREELVNFMDKLHEVRNTTYLAVGTIFASSVFDKFPFLCTLLIPLFFILPAYRNAVNYWVCVRKASAYLIVFHESYEDCPIHWESRHNMFNDSNQKKLDFRKSKSIFSNIPIQLIPYYTCAGATLVAYILRVYIYIQEAMALDMSFDFWKIIIDGMPILVHIIIFIFTMFFLFIYFIRVSLYKSYNAFLIDFLLIADEGVQSNIGVYWQNGKYSEEDYRNKRNEIAGNLGKSSKVPKKISNEN